MARRVELGRILGNGCQHRALGEGQVGDILIKIALGSYLDTQGIVAQVNGVQVVGDDQVLCFLLAHPGITGDYICEVVAEVPMDMQERGMFLRLQVPVSLRAKDV